MKDPFYRCEKRILALVVETFVIIVNVNMEADQIRTCVNMNVCVWSEVYSVVLTIFTAVRDSVLRI